MELPEEPEEFPRPIGGTGVRAQDYPEFLAQSGDDSARSSLREEMRRKMIQQTMAPQGAAGGFEARSGDGSMSALREEMRRRMIQKMMEGK